MKERLLQVLSKVTPTDAKEAADLATMRDFAASLPSPFARDQWPAHFTASAVVVSKDLKQVVLVHHAKLKRWLQPGGHIEPADAGALDAAALREATEETGLDVRPLTGAPEPLDVDVHVIPARQDEPEHRHLDVRFALVSFDDARLAHDPKESFGAQWLSWDDALARADEAPLRRLLEKARAAAGRTTIAGSGGRA